MYTLITGAGSGLGAALCKEYAAHGHNILLVSLPGEGLAEAAVALEKEYGIKTDYIEIDLSKDNAPQEVFNRVKEHNYTVNILINNAGVGGSFPFEDSSERFLRLVIDVNIRATVFLTKLFLPMLKAADGAHIINIGSMASYFPIPYKTIYPASKAFVARFTLTLRSELRGTGVKVCLINPGSMLTNDLLRERVKEFGPLARAMTQMPEAVAKVVYRKMKSGTGVFLPGWYNRLNLLFLRILPSFVRTRVLKKIYKKDYENILKIEQRRRNNNI